MTIHFKTDSAFRNFFGDKYKCYYYTHDHHKDCQYIAIYNKTIQKYELRRFLNGRDKVYIKYQGWEIPTSDTLGMRTSLSWDSVINIVTLDIL